MKIIVFIKRENETVKSLTLIGRLMQKTLQKTANTGFSYRGRMLYKRQATEFRPTIPSLLFHLLKFIFSSKKSLCTRNQN